MNGYFLRPSDNNYVTSNKIYQNLTQETIELTLNASNCEASEGQAPTLHLNGQGVGYLTGSVELTHATPPAGMPLFTFPENIPLLQNVQLFPLTQFNGSVYSTNYLALFNGSNSIASVTVGTAGRYATIPAVETNGPGEGFIGTANVKAALSSPTAAGTGYVPGNTWELTGGTTVGGVKFTGVISQTKVVSATIHAAGTGGTDGTATVTGTTGTVASGTRFQASVTIAGGIITAVNSITVAGIYNTNPTSIAAEPVTGGGLTGAELTVVMGVSSVQFTNAGRYSVIPAGPGYATTATSGSGTGMQLSILWGVNDVVVANGGFGYTDASTIEFVGGTPTIDAVASIVLSSNPELPTGELANASTVGDVISLDGITFLTGSY